MVPKIPGLCSSAFIHPCFVPSEKANPIPQSLTEQCRLSWACGGGASRGDTTHSWGLMVSHRRPQAAVYSSSLQPGSSANLPSSHPLSPPPISLSSNPKQSHSHSPPGLWYKSLHRDAWVGAPPVSEQTSDGRGETSIYSSLSCRCE